MKTIKIIDDLLQIGVDMFSEYSYISNSLNQMDRSRASQSFFQWRMTQRNTVRTKKRKLTKKKK